MPVAMYLVEVLTVISAVAFLLAGTAVMAFAGYLLQLSVFLIWVFTYF